MSSGTGRRQRNAAQPGGAQAGAGHGSRDRRARNGDVL